MRDSDQLHKGVRRCHMRRDGRGRQGIADDGFGARRKPLLRPFASQRFDLMATLEERRDQLTPHESSAASDKHEVFFLNHGVETPMSLCS